MKNAASPARHGKAVTVLTPVYNGADYLPECIESVLAQSFTDWSYVIVDNKSTDRTLEIAHRYAQADERIRVVANDTFLSMPSNFNRAFGLVPVDSRYVKVVCADDWIMPTCLAELVRHADRHPSVGVVVCHQQSGERVLWRGLPPEVDFLPGREACRLGLLQGVHILGSPTASLYRADMIREGPFFPNESPHCDTSACYEKLDRWDFGFVHKVLSVERVHARQISSRLSDVAAGNVAYVEVLVLYGPRYLDEPERSARFAEVYSEYCRGLGLGVLNLKGKEFWDYQRGELEKLGLEIDYGLVLRGALASMLANAARPAAAVRKLKAALLQSFGR
jgi:glycosyltransferase involved in cell wall biosynthesis